MRYLHLFETTNEFDAYYNGDDYIQPFVSVVEQDESVHYNKIVDYSKASITFDLISCHAEINGATISSGYQVPIGQPLEIAIDGDYLEYDWNCMILTMNGQDISSLFDGGSNPTIIEISSVTGDIYMEIECNDAGQDPAEDVMVESIEFTNLPEDHAIELNVGDVVDMSQYIEVSPSDATDSSYTLTTDAPSVLSVNETTITVLQGAEGLTANLTVTANDGSGCEDTMIVDILNGDDDPDEPEEPDVPIESIRYTDGQGSTCIGFNMLEGESVDLWTNLEVLPADATDGVEFTSSDNTVIEVDGTGIATATGISGDSATITISSMGDPSIYTTIEISISEDEPEEEEE